MLPAVAISKVKAAFVQRMNSTDMGSLKYGLAVRWADADSDEPGDWEDIDTSTPTLVADTNTTRIITDKTVGTAGEQWVQFGVVYELSSAGAAMADMMVAIATR